MNIRSIRNKKDEFFAQVNSEDPDIISITESWLKTTDRDFIEEYNINGYCLLNKDRCYKTGGGIMVYVKDGIKVNMMEGKREAQYDLLPIEIELEKKSTIIFGTVYRPPKKTKFIDEEMYDEIKTLAQNKEVILVGDFNYPNINWTTLESDHEGDALMSFLDDNFYNQKITEPTRGNNTLDLIICSDDDIINDIEIGEKFSTSDHNIIRFNLNVKVEIAENKLMVPNFRRANFVKLEEEIGTTNWNEIFGDGDSDKMWNAFRDKLGELVARNIPMKVKRLNDKKKEE